MKRLLAFAIAVMMVFAMVPVSVSAADAAPAAVDGVITLSDGTYYLSTDNSTTDQNKLDDNNLKEIKGNGIGKTFLSLYTAWGDKTALRITAENRTLKVSGVTIDGGGASGTRGFSTLGRGAGSVREITFENCEFKDLTTGAYLDATTNVTFINCTFTNCTAAVGTDLHNDTNGNVTFIDCTFNGNGEIAGWTGDGTISFTNSKGSDTTFYDYSNGGAAVELVDGYGEWTRGDDGALAFTDNTPAPTPDPEEDEEEEATPNFFLFMFMKRLLTEYAVELVFDETMGIVEVDDEDGYVRFSNDAVITVAALEGYEVESVLVNGEAVELDEDGTYTIKRIRKDAKVEVTFAEIVKEEIEDAE